MIGHWTFSAAMAPVPSATASASTVIWYRKDCGALVRGLIANTPPIVKTSPALTVAPMARPSIAIVCV
jgi:hypothetical protein